jgi:CheY-like chemotaxis protein
MMPVMDGFAFLAEQHQDPRLALIPVVVVTAMGRIPNSDALHIAAVVPKPVDVDHLLELVEEHCTRKLAIPIAGRHVLIVDGAEYARTASAAAIGLSGHVVREAAGAEEALRALAEDQPDVILVDIDLPDESGDDIARWVRALGRDEYRPRLVALLGSAADFDARRARAAGFDTCVPKADADGVRNVIAETPIRPRRASV